MASFVYRTAAMGARAAGATIDAPDRAAAVRELVRRGETPLSVDPVAQGGAVEAPGAVEFSWLPVMSRVEMASMIRELSVALTAGLPLVQSLRTIARQGRSAGQKEMLRSVIEQVEAGKSLAEAMAAWGAPFQDLTINLTRAGEASGKLAEVLSHAAELLDKDVKLRRSLLGATLYPLIILGLVVIAIIVVVTVIVPGILKQLSGAAATLPWPTQIVKGFSDFFAGYWYIIIPVVLVGVLAAHRYYRTPEGRMAVDEKLLRIPIVGRLLRDVAVARFTRTLGTLTSSGVPIVQALRITRGTLGNVAMERVIDQVVEQVSAGKTIADPMEQSGYFPPMLVQIVNLGERSGRLDEMLMNASRAFEEKTEQSIKLFTTALPPILVVMLACVVGFVVLAILMALLQVQDAAMAG
ncbi:MAG: type II secretion system F family protein [Phycisphaerales bacterium]|nr:type II secretion system F family protein [Phycisphaerales bacterium]